MYFDGKKTGEANIPRAGRRPENFRRDVQGLRGDPSDQDLHIPLLEFHLGSQGIGAEGAEVFVLVPLRQNQEEAFANRDRPAAARTKKLAGFKLAEGRLGLPRWIRTS